MSQIDSYITIANILLLRGVNLLGNHMSTVHTPSRVLYTPRTRDGQGGLSMFYVNLVIWVHGDKSANGTANKQLSPPRNVFPNCSRFIYIFFNTQSVMSLYFCATDSQEEPMARFQTQCNFQNMNWGIGSRLLHSLYVLLCWKPKSMIT